MTIRFLSKTMRVVGRLTQFAKVFTSRRFNSIGLAGYERYVARGREIIRSFSLSLSFPPSRIRTRDEVEAHTSCGKTKRRGQTHGGRVQ